MGSSSPGAFVIQFTPELVLQLAEEDGGKVPKRRPSKPKPKPRPMPPKSKPEPLPPPGVPMFGMLPRPGLPGYQHPPFHHAVPPVPPRGATEIEDEKPEAEEPQKEEEAARPDQFRREESVNEEEEPRHEAPKGTPEEIPKVEEKEEVKFEKKDESEFKHLDEEQSHPVVVARDLQPLMKILEKTEKYSEELQKRGLGELEEMKQRAQELQHKQYMPVSKTVPCSIEREACIKCYKEKDALQCKAAVEALKRCTLEALRG